MNMVHLVFLLPLLLNTYTLKEEFNVDEGHGKLNKVRRYNFLHNSFTTTTGSGIELKEF